MKVCRYCHTTEKITRDHIIPKSRGGKNSEKNIQDLCHRCNSTKGNLTDEEVAKLFRWFKYIQENRKAPLNWKEDLVANSQ